MYVSELRMSNLAAACIQYDSRKINITLYPDIYTMFSMVFFSGRSEHIGQILSRSSLCQARECRRRDRQSCLELEMSAIGLVKFALVN